MQLEPNNSDPWSVTCVLDEAVMIVTMTMTRVLRLSCVGVWRVGRVRCKHITLTPPPPSVATENAIWGAVQRDAA